MAPEWEEVTMMMELPSGGHADSRKQGDSYFQILGLSTEKPLVKINGHLFNGQFTDTLGSHLFLEVEEKSGAKPTKDSSQRNNKQIKFVAVTDRYLKLEPVYLELKKGAESQ
ncbi:hypothetical protein BsWGS_02162 [Bradybaena similaris]